MNNLIIGIISFFIIFIIQIIFILMKSKSKIILKIFLAFISSLLLSFVIFLISTIIFLGNNLSIWEV